MNENCCVGKSNPTISKKTVTLKELLSGCGSTFTLNFQFDPHKTLQYP